MKGEDLLCHQSVLHLLSRSRRVSNERFRNATGRVPIVPDGRMCLLKRAAIYRAVVKFGNIVSGVHASAGETLEIVFATSYPGVN